MKEPKTHNNIVYAIHYKGQLLGSFQWGRGSELQGWRPPKKVYWKLGLARSGASHLPEDILDECEIVEYSPVKVVEKLSKKDRQKKRLQKELFCAESNISYFQKQIINNPTIQKEEIECMKNKILGYETKVKELKKRLASS